MIANQGKFLLLLKTAPRSIVETEKFDMPTKPASRNDIITKGTVEQITDETEIVKNQQNHPLMVRSSPLSLLLRKQRLMK